MRYPHIVFDIDNTLIDTTAAVLHSLQKALRDRGAPGGGAADAGAWHSWHEGL